MFREASKKKRFCFCFYLFKNGDVFNAFRFIEREGKNDNDIVLEMCNEITSLLPEKILPVFSKGRHLDLKEALGKLKEKLGDLTFLS